MSHLKLIRSCLIQVFFIGFLLWAPTSLMAQGGDWEKVSEDDGIEVFKKELPGSPLIAFKGQGVVDASIFKLIQILLDDSRSVEWVDDLVEAKQIRRISETEVIEYNHIKTPVVMKDRDFVIQCKAEADPKNKVFVLKMKSVKDPSAPQTDYVRGEIMDSSFTIKSLDNGTKTHVVAEIHADPKGSVANWIINMFQKKWPRNTLEGLRKQAVKPDVQENLYYKKLFGGLRN